MVNMGAQPPYPHEKTKWGSICLMAEWLPTARAGLTDFSVPPFGCGKARPIKRSRAFLKHGGGAPIPPLLGNRNGVVRGESTCGGQRLCEHLLPGKAIASAAYGTDGLHYSANRVRPPQERACAL